MSSETTPPPPVDVLRAFGLRDGPLMPLAGNISQTAWRVGDAVVKRAQDPLETEWAAAIFDAVVEEGFRVHRPISTRAGAWIADGWTAWRWIEGNHEAARWRDVLAASRALHRAIPAAARAIGRDERPAWLDARTHRWAVAERVVWHGAEMPTTAVYDVPEWELWDRARALGPALTSEEAAASQVVHGDVSGNVLSSPAFEEVVFIDMSPGWRPASSVEAQIAVESVAWHGGDESLLEEIAARPGGRAAMARACAFRVLCGFQALFVGGGFNPRETERFARVLDAIGA